MNIYLRTNILFIIEVNGFSKQRVVFFVSDHARI